MDIGMIVIHLAVGTPVVSRCEQAPTGTRLIAATNAAALAQAAQKVLHGQGVALHEDGIYLCSDQLQALAEFPPLVLPADAISFGDARAILYPDASYNTGWQRVHRDVEAGRLHVYRVGIGQSTRQYVSRADVQKLADRRAQHVLA